MEKVVWKWTDVRDRSFSINHICSYPNYCMSYYWPFAVCDLCVWSDIFLISFKVEMVQGILVNCDIKLSVETFASNLCCFTLVNFLLQLSSFPDLKNHKETFPF